MSRSKAQHLAMSGNDMGQDLLIEARYAITVFSQTIVQLVTALLIWIQAVVIHMTSTISFLLLAPFREYLDPLETEAKCAETYEQWREIQSRIDHKHLVHEWANQDENNSYDWRGLEKFREDLVSSRKSNDIASMRGHLRSQAVRNCCLMLSSKLYLKSQIQTKKLIHDYVHEVRRCIDRLMRKETTIKTDQVANDDEKRKLFSEIRQILGRTTLVLQGGAMLSMCHFGVVKALHRRRLLPKIITATGTGALPAAIVGCTPDDQLLAALEGHAVNIQAFMEARERRLDVQAGSFPLASWVRAIIRRTRRFIYTGHFFDIEVLTRCIRDNIGDITFEEAHVKSGRILNITIAKPDLEGTPQLLNYITAPHVVIWSAVAASISTSKKMFAAAPLACKNNVGVIERYRAANSSSMSHARPQMSNPRIPMERIGELFDVNHYIVSQTRPYIIPFVQLQQFMSKDPILDKIVNVVYCEILHRLETLNRLGLLPTAMQRILIDELIPSTSSWSKFVITPKLSLLDCFKIFNFPSPNVIDDWARKGEKSMWPVICQIKIRCCVELEIDAACRKGAIQHDRYHSHPRQSISSSRA